MTFKLNAATGSTNRVNKQYLFPVSDAGYPCRDWVYVSADTVAAVTTSGYIDFSANPTDADHEIAKDMLRVGDRIWIYQVGSIADTRSIEDDIAAGVTDLGLAIVLVNAGGVVNLSNDVLSIAGVSYTT